MYAMGLKKLTNAVITLETNNWTFSFIILIRSLANFAYTNSVYNFSDLFFMRICDQCVIKYQMYTLYQ